MSAASASDVRDWLVRQRLVEAARLDEIVRSLATNDRDGSALVDALVRAALLTPFQASEIAASRSAELLHGDYLLLERLGEGGMGQVYKARHRATGDIVALKILHRDRQDPEVIRRFLREVEAIARLSHPNIVAAAEAGQEKDALFLAMELVDGIDLARLVKERGPLPIDRASNYIRQSALGLQHAHERGLVHRDIKPANLLVTTRGEVVKILDLGLARFEYPAGESPTTLTKTGAVMGTPDYIAPEQARNSRDVDIRADLYSLGCTLYFLLTGLPPFPEGTLIEKLLKHQMDTPTPVRQLRPEVPVWLAAVLDRFLAKKPADRFQTPAEAAAALVPPPPGAEPVLLPPTVVTTPADPFDFASPSMTALSPPKRSTRLVTFLTALAGLLTLFLGLLIYIGLHPRTPATRATSEVLPPEVESDDQAVAELRLAGAEVTIDRTASGRSVRVTCRASQLKDEDLRHLKAILSLRVVDLDAPELTDDALQHLHETPITELRLKGQHFKDTTLTHLSFLPRLDTLSLANVDITGSALAKLKDVKSLRHLEIEGRPFREAGAKNLGGCVQLQQLTLKDCAFTDELLTHLATLEHLRVLDLSENQVTGPGLEHLASMKELRELHLHQTPIRDDGLMHIAALHSLQRLDLSGTAITDVGLKQLAELKQLHHLNLRKTTVTMNGLRMLRTSFGRAVEIEH